MCKYKISVIVFAAWIFSQAQGAVLQVRHDHYLWGKCTGELIITDRGIEYRTEKKSHTRRWHWVDIQSFDRKTQQRFSILTYEDQKWRLGSDRHFDFITLDQTPPLDETNFQFISEHLTKPLVDRMVRNAEPEYQVAVKHLHRWGGCQGILTFARDWIVYETDHLEDVRAWRRDRDVESVWSLHRYELEINVFEENQLAFDKTRRFRFQLKQALDEAYYHRLRRQFLSRR